MSCVDDYIFRLKRDFPQIKKVIYFLFILKLDMNHLRLKCPKCGNIIEIKDTGEMPLRVVCGKCGGRFILKEKRKKEEEQYKKMIEEMRKRDKERDERKRKRIEEQEREEQRIMAFEEKQRRKGLIKFVDKFGEGKWGMQEDVEKWKREDEEKREKEKLINRVIAEIKDFKPARKQLELEYNYQLNLHGYLSKTFPSARIEEQRGSSRPDIVIDNIAIEIKGPTKSQDLATIADKCIRYGEHFPDGIIIVLFEVEVNDRRYKEWLEGIKKYFPQVEVIRKVEVIRM
jgi:DNA-directed RNA polymerase subunit M/transcription elongation factor TFIIS